MSNLATWFTPSLKVMSRTNGDSAVAAAAYRACLNLEDERTGLMHPYKGKSGHVSTELIGFTDIKKLWNDAEKSETRKNSSVCREIMVPMPHDWTDAQRKLCAHQFGEMLRARYGVAVQVSIHRQKDGSNDHAHILFTTRVVDENGVFGKKTRILDEGLKNGEVSNLREAVCDIMNQHAKANGSNWFAYAGKFVDIDPDHIPTVKIPRNCPPERRAELEAQNAATLEARDQLKRISQESKELTQQINEEIIEEARKASPIPEVTNEIAPELFEVTSINEKVNVGALDWSPNNRPVTPLARAFVLRDNAETMAKYQAAQAINKPKLYEWERRLAELENEAPKNWGILRGAVESMALLLGVETYETKRIKKIEKAKEQIVKARTNEQRFLKVLTNPQRIADLEEWNRNPNHKAIIEGSRDPTPDEIYARLRKQQEDAYKPPPDLPQVATASTPWDKPWNFNSEQKKPWDESPP